MSNLTIGDLAGSFQSRLLSARLKTELTQLGRELTTGLREDVSSRISGDYGPIAGIEHSLKALQAFKTATAETATLTDAAQLALENIQNTNHDMTPALMTAGNSRNATLIQTTAVDARQQFTSLVSALNTRVADRTIFAGAATDGPALANATDMMTELVSASAGATTAADVAAAVDTWFDTPGGGFETLGYIGSANAMGPTQLGEGESLGLTTRADDQVVRDLLKSYAKSALIAEGALAGNVTEQANLTDRAAQGILTADGGLTNLRAGVGSLQGRIEDISVQNTAEQSALELARSDLIAVDPYQTASELEAVYGQIETLYTVTSRIARLNFTDYMK